MSEFSGKYDFYDHLFMLTENKEDAFNKFKGTKLYVHKPANECVETKNIEDALNLNYNEIKYNSIDDLIKYYPHTIAIALFNREIKKSIIYLSSRSWVDVEEEEILSAYLKEILRCYNRDKRNKRVFNKEDAFKKTFWCTNKEAIQEIIDRVDKYGKKATYEGIELDISKFYRSNLMNELNK